MTDVILFIVVGGIAVAAAVMMLLSENAVHSALFLIVNFACVAFLYVMLDAPFLAMIQIAVYAGAIMVLFLFVIMLLGAEKLMAPARQFRWLAPLSLVLAAAFLLVTGLAIIQGRIDLQGPVARDPFLRVVHAAQDTGAVDVYANDTLLATNVTFGHATDFRRVPAGEYLIKLTRPGTTDLIGQSQVVVLASDPQQRASAFTAVAYGPGSGPVIAVQNDSLEPTDARTGRISIFNAYTGVQNVRLVDRGSESDPTDDRVLVEALGQEQQIELPPVAEGTELRSWAFVDADRPATILLRLNNPDLFNVRRDTANFMVLASETLFDGSTRTVALPLVAKTASSFGSPTAIGEVLFTRFLLPFQLVAILLLAAMIGAIVLTHKEDFTPRRRDVRRRVMKPLTSVISDQLGKDVLTPETAQPMLPDKQPEVAGD